jgi:hypothetical protein
MAALSQKLVWNSDRAAPFAKGDTAIFLIFQMTLTLSTADHFQSECCAEVTDFRSALY